MKIIIDKNKCIGCGSCAAVCPDYFKLGKNGKSELIKQPKEQTPELKDAAASCPAQCIEFKD